MSASTLQCNAANLSRPKGRYTLPVFTGRDYGCQKRRLRAVKMERVHR